METKPYVRIDFINCDMEYNYTICPSWSDVPFQLQAAESNFVYPNETYKLQPEVKLSVIYLTDDEFGNEISKWDK